MSSPIKTCVIGVGLAGLTFHVPFILALPEHFQLHSVLERNPSSEGGKVKERFGISVKIHRTLEEVLGDAEVELVIIATPNQTHFPFAKAALEAGKHVLVDKPITQTAEHARALGELAKSKNLVLYAYQNRRWDSDFLACKEAIHSSLLGDIVEFESHYDRYRADLKGSWKDESGLVYDLGSHLIDQTLVLFGLPDKITAFLENVRGIGDPDTEDCFTILLQYNRSATKPKPITAILRAHILSVKSIQVRFIVRGDKGTLVKYGLDVQEDQLKAITDLTDIHGESFGCEPESIWGIIETLDDSGKVLARQWPSQRGKYIELFRNLAGVIRGTEEYEVKWEEATKVIEIIELAKRSSAEGRTVVLT